MTAPPTPPLILIAFFRDDVPAPIDLPPGEEPLFAAQRILAPFPWLNEALHDGTQSLADEERTSIASARSALVLRCDDGADPIARVQCARDRIALLIDRGAVGVILPAAHKVLAHTEIAATLAAGGAAWMGLFVHCHAIEDGDSVWYHTHGLEHFGLPDLERRAPRDEAANADRLLRDGIHHILRHGAIDGDAPFATNVAPSEADHDFGPWGALALRPRGTVQGTNGAGH